MSNVFQLMNQPFPTMFKSPPGESNGSGVVSVAGRTSSGGVGSQAGQKVVCTPEVSLYQYSSEMAAVAAAAGGHLGGAAALQRIMEEKGLVGGGGNEGGNNGGAISPGGNGGVMNHPTVPGPNGGFQCGFCGKTFQQKNTFQNHLRSHREGDDPYQCDICGKTFAVPARLTRHYRTHTGEKPYQCEYCNKSFSVKENLSVHRRIHTKERPYKCDVCERAFEHSGKLHRHMRIHTGERPHRCQICQKTFIQSGQLVIHMRTHTGEKPYVCKVCGKGFTCSKQLKVHTRTHTGEKPYTCDICGKSFGYNHVLKLHQVAHYGEKVYKCTLCNGTFTSKKALESHIKTHSEDHVPTGPSSPRLHGNVTEPGVMPHGSSLLPSSHSAPPSQNSDKENRECSDSELSSQNSPVSTDGGSKTPPSPAHMLYSSAAERKMQGGGFKTSSPSSSSTNNNSNTSNNSSSNNNSQDKTSSSSLPIPYPMLPPGVQIQQAPHSRTTFLYVTSKLPNPPNNSSTSLSSSSSTCSTSPPPQSPPLVRREQPSHLSPNSFVGHGNNAESHQQQLQQQFAAELKDASENNGRSTNKLLMHKIREKVLQFTEQFGYGLSPAEREHLQKQQQQQQQQQVQSKNAQKRFVEGGNNANCNARYSPVSNVSIHPHMVPKFSLNNNNNNNVNNKAYHGDDSMYHQNRLRHHQQLKRETCSSPEMTVPDQIGSNYTPGGVLALALTQGSKVAVAATSQNLSPNHLHTHHNIPAKVSLIPVTSPNSSSSGGLFNGFHNLHQQQHHSQQLSRLSPRSSSPSSPIDFRHHQLQQHQHLNNNGQFYMREGDHQGRPGSVSPARNSVHSPSPNSTPRSTPSLQEDYSDHDTQISGKAVLMGGDMSGDENSSSSSSSMTGGGNKRSRSPNSNSSGGGPRKRSSLILEKYERESNPTPRGSANTPPPSGGNGNESILSQRLRLSSVIQYAEKCS